METCTLAKRLDTPESLHPVLLYSDPSPEALVTQLKALLGTPNPSLFFVCDHALMGPIKQHWGALADYMAGFPVFSRFHAEAHKTPQALQALYTFLIQQGAHRASTLVALGGGAVMDLTGFAAATFLRGIAYYNLPTTLLGMVDAGMGGKTGINLPEGKNLIGCHHAPQATVLWPDFLKTLPAREWSSGMAEAIKHALLGGLPLDALHTDTLEIHTLLEASCRYKLALTSKDPRETQGMRVFLNLGHTFAHAIESLTQYQEYLHGEAVSIGLYLACLYSERAYGLPSQVTEGLKALLSEYALPTRLRTPLPIEGLMSAMKRDKKNQETGALYLVTLKAIGEPFLEKAPRLDWIEALWSDAGGYHA